MTKSELIDAVAARAGMKRQRAEEVVETIFDWMSEALSRGESIEVRGFGTFTVRPYQPYRGRNPKTGVPVEVSAKSLPVFRAGTELREIVNAGRHRPLVDGE
ncbi:MAG: integration host factor subunit beta [Polyangiaceae bacterium]|nr:integration host factor subunit beta [Polyangiaceae bacterium]